MNIKFIPTCDKKGCDSPSAFVRYRMGAKGFIKSMYYCDKHKKDGDVSIVAEQEAERIERRRKTAERSDGKSAAAKEFTP